MSILSNNDIGKTFYLLRDYSHITAWIPKGSAVQLLTVNDHHATFSCSNMRFGLTQPNIEKMIGKAVAL